MKGLYLLVLLIYSNAYFSFLNKKFNSPLMFIITLLQIVTNKNYS